MCGEYEHIRIIVAVYMDEYNRVIANIPVRKGLEERYGVHINVATDIINRESKPMEIGNYCTAFLFLASGPNTLSE